MGGIGVGLAVMGIGLAVGLARIGDGMKSIGDGMRCFGKGTVERFIPKSETEHISDSTSEVPVMQLSEETCAEITTEVMSALQPLQLAQDRGSSVSKAL
jgi:hypothetical protein